MSGRVVIDESSSRQANPQAQESIRLVGMENAFRALFR